MDEKKLVIGTTKDEIYLQRTRMAISFINKNMKLCSSDFYLQIKELDNNYMDSVENLCMSIKDGKIDGAVVELYRIYELIEKYKKENDERMLKYIDGLDTALVFKRGNPLSVLITMKKTGVNYTVAAVECDNVMRMKYLEDKFEGVITREMQAGFVNSVDHLRNQECDAIYMSADHLKLLKGDRYRDLRYSYFEDNAVEYAGIWVLLVKKEKEELKKMLAGLSDRKTVECL